MSTQTDTLLIAIEGAIANLTTLAEAVERLGCPGTADAAREGIRLYQRVVDTVKAADAEGRPYNFSDAMLAEGRT
jgi:hypothetical protein